MATFSTWSDLYSSMLDVMASGEFNVAELRKDGTHVVYRSFKDVVDNLGYVRTMAGYESGACARRTIAKGNVKF